MLPHAEIVHDMTEIAGQELSGGIKHAPDTLKAVQAYAQKILMA
ncbi:hypothetical protein [Acidobacterium sp. S8]|nr:hypothetical protein [Acidobacterium sp. S8]